MEKLGSRRVSLQNKIMLSFWTWSDCSVFVVKDVFAICTSTRCKAKKEVTTQIFQQMKIIKEEQQVLLMKPLFKLCGWNMQFAQENYVYTYMDDNLIYKSVNEWLHFLCISSLESFNHQIDFQFQWKDRWGSSNFCLVHFNKWGTICKNKVCSKNIPIPATTKLLEYTCFLS